jgi:peptide deformylase
MIKDVLQQGDSRLSNISTPIQISEFNTPQLRDLITDMYDTMKYIQGVGIAAIQIGIAKRIAIIEYDTTNTRYSHIGSWPFTVVINPEIEPLQQDMTLRDEGCLSVRTKRGVTARYTAIKYKFYNQFGELVTGETDLFFARVIQHELDHMNGILFIERVPDKNTIYTLNK